MVRALAILLIAVGSGTASHAAPPCTASQPDSIVAGAGTGSSDGQHFVMSNGVRLWYCVAGKGAAGSPPVVFLHGGPGQGTYHFAALAGPAAEQTMRIVYFDQRGTGRSAKPPKGEYSIPLLVDDIEALRAALGVPRIALIGHSFGGTLALEYATKYPDRVSHIVFVSGLWSMPAQCSWRLKTLEQRRPEAYARVRLDTLDQQGRRRNDCELEMRAFDSGRAREAYGNEAMFPDSVVRIRLDSTQNASGFRNSGEMGAALFQQGLLRYDFGQFARLKMPVLVIAGRYDGAARPEGLRLLAKRLPHAQFKEFDRSGHFVYLDEPTRFAREVARFIRKDKP